MDEQTPYEDPLADRKLLSVEQVSRLLGVGRRTVYRLTESGELRAVYPRARLMRWRPADVEDFILRRTKIRTKSAR